MSSTLPDARKRTYMTVKPAMLFRMLRKPPARPKARAAHSRPESEGCAQQSGDKAVPEADQLNDREASEDSDDVEAVDAACGVEGEVRVG